MDKQAMKIHGAFSWNELMTNDVKGAKVFYSAMFGWDIVQDKGASMPYHMINLGKDMIGGMMANPPEAKGAPPAWGCYITVDDVDKQAARVESLGGKIHIAPMDIPEVGRFAVIADPQGAMLNIITYSS